MVQLTLLHFLRNASALLCLAGVAATTLSAGAMGGEPAAAIAPALPGAFPDTEPRLAETNPPAPGQKLLQQAQQAYEQQDWDAALTLLNQAINTAPPPLTLAEIQLNLALVHIQLKQLPEAEAALTAAQPLIPHLNAPAHQGEVTGPWALLRLQALVQRLQVERDAQFPEALQAAHRFYQRLREAGQPISPSVSLSLAQALNRLGRRKDAQQLLEALPKQSVVSLTQLGSIASSQGKLAEAEQLFQQAEALPATPEEARYLKFERAQLLTNQLHRQTEAQLFGGLAEIRKNLQPITDSLQQFQGADRLDPPTQVQANLAQLQLLSWVLPQLHRGLNLNLTQNSRIAKRFQPLSQSQTNCADLPPLPPQPQPDPSNDPSNANDANDEITQADEAAVLKYIYCTTLRLNQQRLALITRLQEQLVAEPNDRLGVDHRVNFATSLVQSSKVFNEGKGLPFLPKVLRQQIEQQAKASDQQAVVYLAPTVKQAQTLSYPRGMAEALALLSQIYQRANQLEPSQRLAEVGLALGGNGADIAYRLQWQIARSQRQQNQLGPACATYQTTVSTVQSLRRNLVAVNQDVQYSFRDQVLPIYREAIETCLAADGDTPSNDRLIQVRNLLESLQLAELDNFFKEACIEGRPQQMDSLIDRPTSKAAAIYTIVSEQRFDVLVKLPNQPALLHQSYSVSKEMVEQQAQTFSNLVQKAGQTRDANVLTNAASTQLYQWLVGDPKIQQALEKAGVETLVFILDGSLRNLPIAALVTDPNSEQPFLIQRYALAVTPGLQFAFGDQTEPKMPFSRALGGGLTIDPQATKYSALATAQSELETVKTSISPQRSVTLLGPQFSSQQLEEQLRRTYFPVVHFATHAEFSSNSDTTGIVMQDQFLPVSDFSNLLKQSFDRYNRPIELLVMSACETAQGDGRSILGLSAIATRSGVRSTLGTLWKITDARTGQEEDQRNQFLKTFYDHLKTHGGRAKALQAAQANSANISPVRDWAAFVLVGEWQ